MNGTNYWTRRSMTRRTMLRGTFVGITGLAGAALLGCGGGSSTTTGTGTATSGSAAPSGAAGAAAQVKRGGTLRPAVTAEPTKLDPVRGQGGGDHKFFWTMSEGLTQYNQEGVPDPQLSLSDKWEIVDPVTIKFALRQGIKFHDGTPFDAQAVKFNIERVQNPDTQSAARAQILPITKVDVVDASNVVFHLDRPNAALVTLLGDRGGQMGSPGAITKLGKAYDKAPVGTGPFKFVRWAEEQNIRVERNPEYWRKGVDGKPLPYVDAVEWQLIPDTNVSLAGLQAGNVQIVDLAAALNQVDKYSKDAQYQVISFPGTAWSGAYHNLTIPPMDDVNFRRAIAWSIDRKSINDSLYFGTQLVVPEGMGIITPALKWAYAPVPTAPKFDLAKAKQYLAASKYPNGAKIRSPIGTTTEAAAAGALWQDMLKKNIGIQLEHVPSRTTTDDMWVAQTYHALMPSSFSLRADPDGTVAEVVSTEGFYNAGHFKNPMLDDLIAKARESYDRKERAVRYAEVEKILADQIYDVYSHYMVQFRAASKSVQNLKSIFGAEGKDHYAELWLSA